MGWTATDPDDEAPVGDRLACPPSASGSSDEVILFAESIQSAMTRERSAERERIRLALLEEAETFGPSHGGGSALRDFARRLETK